MKAQVTERALVARVNRKLADKGRQLRRARGFWDGKNWHEDNNLGRYFVLDLNRNNIVDHHVDLEEYARIILVLAAWEKLAEEA